MEDLFFWVFSELPGAAAIFSIALVIFMTASIVLFVCHGIYFIIELFGNVKRH